MTGVLITRILLAFTFTVVSVFGACWIMTTCAAIADEKWDKLAEGLLFGCFVDILIFLIIYGMVTTYWTTATKTI